jgi:hypothetical protein
MFYGSQGDAVLRFLIPHAWRIADATMEPNIDWDRENPNLSVGVSFPNIDDFRLDVRQRAIVKEFELATSPSDHDRFRGHCASLGCPWIIRGRTQHDGTARV